MSTALALAAALVPPIAVGLTIDHHGVNVPFWDQWDFVALLAEAAEGRLHFEWLWHAHNEHRLVVPRLVFLGLGLASGWNVRAEMAANLAVALGQLGLVGMLLRRTVHTIEPAATPWLVLLSSLLIFSLAAYQNWTWGWQLQIFLNALAALVAVVVLERWRGEWSRAIAVSLAGAVAALSFASGIVLLALVPVALATSPNAVDPWRRRWQALGSGVFGASVAGSYLVGLSLRVPPGGEVVPPVASVVQYALAYLGGVFGGRDLTAATWAGLAALITFGATAFIVWTRQPERRRVAFPWVVLGTHALLCGAVTAAGRAGIRGGQPLEGRYVSLSVLLWVSMLALLTVALGPYLRSRQGRLRWVTVGVLSGILLLLAFPYCAAWRFGEWAMSAHADGLRRRRPCILYAARAPADCLAFYYPDPEELKKRLARLEPLTLGPFAGRRRERPLSEYVVASHGRAVGHIAGVHIQAGRVRDVLVEAWTLDAGGRSGGDSVLVAVDGEIVGRAGIIRTAGSESRWTLRLPSFRFAPGDHRVEAYLVEGDGERLSKLDGVGRFSSR